jgi:hypothetical protein
MTVYLASPNTQQQAEHAADMPVLFSYAIYDPWMDRYQATFKRILIDCGAWSQHNSGKQVDVMGYHDWSQRWFDHADAIAGVDDIGGDWRKSMKNYAAIPWGFPTYHDSDPPELLDELIPLARERGNWIGLGIKPPREGKERWVRESCDRIPEDLHVHGWALRAYTRVRRLDSVDSSNWFRDAMDIRKSFPWLTYGETLEIVVKRYQRWSRIISDPTEQMTFEQLGATKETA